VTSDEARALEAVERFEEALGRQFDAADARSWRDAPKDIREAHGDPSLADPPSREAMDEWAAWLERRMNSLRLCRENLEKGRDAERRDPARAEVYWKRAIGTAERALAELDVPPDGLETEADEGAGVGDEVVAGYLALLEEHRDRLVVADSVLPAPASRLRPALEQRYQREPDSALAEGLIALPVFVPAEDAVAVERYLTRRAGDTGPIGRATWDRGLTVVERIAGEQRVAMRRILGAAPGGSGVVTPVPVLGGVTASREAAAEMASAELDSYHASLAWTLIAYGATGLGTLVVLGAGAILLGEPVVAVVLVQSVLLVILFLPTLGAIDRVYRGQVRRAVDAGKGPESAEPAAVVPPFVAPIVIALVSWLIATTW
jgi:hypothetical protein